jgi:hypothetical protein
MRIRPAALIAASYLSLSSAAQGFTPSGAIADWLCAGADERMRVTSILVLTAGQGERDDEFFTRCLDQVAADVSASERTIREVAAGCTYMARLTISDSE